MKEKGNCCVSVVMITYGHEAYIKEAIEGVLMQQCSFNIELIIANDNSPDNTDAVVNEIIRDSPNGKWIRYTRHSTNKGMMENFFWSLYQAEGKYIAICEGDDYWTCPSKLQTQVDVMEGDENYSLCFHATQIITRNNTQTERILRPAIIRPSFSIEDLILGGGGAMATNSMLFPSKYLSTIPKWMSEAPVGDLPLMLYLSSQGRVGYIDSVMSAYRSMSEGSWSKTMNHKRKKEHHQRMLKLWDDFDVWSEYKYHKLVARKKKRNTRNYIIGRMKGMLNVLFELRS